MTHEAASLAARFRRAWLAEEADDGLDPYDWFSACGVLEEELAKAIGCNAVEARRIALSTAE